MINHHACWVADIAGTALLSGQPSVRVPVWSPNHFMRCFPMLLATLFAVGIGLTTIGCEPSNDSEPAPPTSISGSHKSPPESTPPTAAAHTDTSTTAPLSNSPRATSLTTDTIDTKNTARRKAAPPKKTHREIDPEDLARRCKEIDMPQPPGLERLPDDMLRNLQEKIEAVAQNPTADTIGRLACLYHALARNREDSSSAVACYEKAKALAPDSYVWPYFLGRVFFTRESLERARSEFLTALANNPEYDRIHFWLGEMELSRKAGSQARKHFQDYIQKMPELADGYVGLAGAELLEENNTAAFEAIQKSLQYDPDCGRAHRVLSVYYTKLDEDIKARKEQALARSLPSLRGRLRNDPLELELWRVCGATRYSLFQINKLGRGGDIDSAVLLAETLLADYPDVAELLVGIARVYARVGKITEAGDLARRAQASAPYAPATELLSHLALRAGDFDSALKFADRTIATDSDDAGGYVARSNALRALDKPEAALKAIFHAAELDPGSARYFRVAGEILLEQNRVLEAKKRFLQALEIGGRIDPFPPSLVPVLMTVANMDIAAGDSEAAIRSLDRVLKFNPSYEPAFRQLADIFFSVGRGTDAIKYCRNLMKHSPQTQGYTFLLAEILDRAGQTVRAKQHIAKVGREFPKHPGVPFTQAVLLVRHGENAQAWEQLKKALDLNPKFERAYMVSVDVLLKLDQPADMVKVLERGLTNLPDSSWICNTLAWVLATHHDAALRDPVRALELSQRALQLVSEKNPNFMDTLACAQAATGDWEGARRSEQEAIDLTLTPEAASEFASRLELFKRGQAYVEKE